MPDAVLAASVAPTATPVSVANRRCLEAQVINLSDDIAYSAHDVEGAIALGSVNPTVLDNDTTLAHVLETTKQWYVGISDPQKPDPFTVDDIAVVYERLRNTPF